MAQDAGQAGATTVRLGDLVRKAGAKVPLRHGPQAYLLRGEGFQIETDERPEAQPNAVIYVRADLADALAAQVEALAAERERLAELLGRAMARQDNLRQALTRARTHLASCDGREVVYHAGARVLPAGTIHLTKSLQEIDALLDAIPPSMMTAATPAPSEESTHGIE